MNSTSGAPAIAYIRDGLFSHTNTRVGEQLARVFPDHEIETLDISKLWLRHPGIVLRNWLEVFRLYRQRIVGRRTRPVDCFLRTPYIFRALRRLIRAALQKTAKRFEFTIQTQSVFDASLPGVPHFLYTDHTHLVNLTYPTFRPENLFDQSWIACEKEIYHAATRAFTMSNHVRRSIIEQYETPEANVVCIFAGNNSRVPDAPLENDGFRNQNILFVGVEWERKGGPELLEAFSVVKRTHPGATLTVVGCSPAGPLPEGCRVTGKVPLAEMAEQYSKASIFCLPTRVEPFGIAFVEAQLHRLPVIGPNLGALPDIIEHGRNGLLFEPGNPASLVAALDELLSSPERCRAYGEAGRASATGRFTWDAVGDRLGREICYALS